MAPVINLMDALKKSMEQQEAVGKKEPQRATATKSATRRKKAS
jgi:non-homologous end joining protein Ku